MSVCAWDGRYLVADRRTTNSYGLITTTTKIHRLNDGGVAGITWSDIGGRNALIAKLNGEPFDKELVREASAIYVRGPIVIEYIGGEPLVIDDKYYAIGSGTDVALALLTYTKCNAMTAVKHVSKMIAGCGNGYDVYDSELDVILLKKHGHKVCP